METLPLYVRVVITIILIGAGMYTTEVFAVFSSPWDIVASGAYGFFFGYFIFWPFVMKAFSE